MIYARVGKLKITIIRIDEDDLAKAKELGVNVSRARGIYREPYSDNAIMRIMGGRGTVGSRLEGRRGDLNPTSWLH